MLFSKPVAASTNVIKVCQPVKRLAHWLLPMWGPDLAHVEASIVGSWVGATAWVGRHGGFSCQPAVQQGCARLAHNILLRRPHTRLGTEHRRMGKLRLQLALMPACV